MATLKLTPRKLKEKYKQEKVVVRLLEKQVRIHTDKKVYSSIVALLRESRREINMIKTKLL